MSRAASTDTRRAMLAKVHIARKQLDIPKEDYCAILEHRFDVSSSGDLTLEQLDQLLAYLTSLGFVATKKGDAKPSRQNQLNKPILTKIGALLVELGQREGRHVSWNYAVGILKRQSGVMRLEWATAPQLRAVVAALDGRIKKLDRDALLAGAGDGHAGPMPF